MFFKFKPFTGPVKYIFKDPDTGMMYSERSKPELIKRITAYRAQNNLEKIEHLGFVIENYLCGLPENIGKCEPVEIRRGLLGTLKGGVALIKDILYKRFVPQEVAEKRASQCVQCKYNVFPDKGPFIEWSDNIRIHATGGRIVSQNEDLGNCDACSCPLRVLFWAANPLERNVTIASSTLASQYLHLR